MDHENALYDRDQVHEAGQCGGDHQDLQCYLVIVGNRITRFGGGGSEDLHVLTDDEGAGHQVRDVGQGGGGVRICCAGL